MASKQSPSDDPFKKLSSMEDYCKDQNIFFNENDRIKHQIKRSKGLYQEFRGSLQRGFNFRHGEDHPHLAELLAGTQGRDQSGEGGLLGPDGAAGADALPEGGLGRAAATAPLSPADKKVNALAARPDAAELREEEQRIQQELENIQRLLDHGEPMHVKATSKRRQGTTRRNPVVKLSEALQRYKSERVGTEDELIKCIQKVNLDKAILFREKQGVLWKDADDQRQTSLEEALRKEKQMRHELNKKQKDAYDLVLQFMKERNTKPVQEEKQILDGIKIILENGWVLQTDEILEFFDSLGLRQKLTVSTENLMFLEFIYLLCRVFDIETTRI